MFLSRSTNALDAKGRVSVPAEFRAFISADNQKYIQSLSSSSDAASDVSLGGADEASFDGIIVWPSFDGAYLEGGGMALMRDFQALLETMDPFDEARIAFERTIFGQCRRLSFDGNGRVSLPRELSDYAGLDGQVSFVGLGRRFEVWNPEHYDGLIETARAAAKANRHRFKLSGGGGV